MQLLAWMMVAKGNRFAVGMGGNCGDRMAFLNRAAVLLRNLPNTSDWQFAPIYETEAVDCPEPFPFLNSAACATTFLEPTSLLKLLLDIEQNLDRKRPYPNAPRTMDLDLLIYEDIVYQTSYLTLPHPRFHARLFVLAPLAQIAPDWRHPVCNQTVRSLYQSVAAQSNASVLKTAYTWEMD